MGTACYVGARYEEESTGSDEIIASYCHYDGYLSGVGMTILENWNGEQAYALASHGYFSSLVETQKELGSRKEKDAHANSDPAIYIETRMQFLKKAIRCGSEFAYLYENGKWYYWEFDYDTTDFDIYMMDPKELTKGSIVPELENYVTYYTKNMLDYKHGTKIYNEYQECVDFYNGKLEEYRND